MNYKKDELLLYLKNTYKYYNVIDHNINKIEIHHKSNISDLVILVYGKHHTYNLWINPQAYFKFLRNYKINKICTILNN